MTLRDLVCLAAALCAAPLYAQAPPTALEGHQGGVASVAYAPDGKIIVSGSLDRTLKIWNAATGAELRSLVGHQGQVLAVAISPNGRQLASGSRDNTIKLWDLYIPTPLQQLAGHTGQVQAVLVNSEPAWSATAGADKLIKLWDAEGKVVRDLKGHDEAILRLAATKDGSQIASGDAKGFVRIWNPLDGASLGILGADTAPVSGLAFHPTTATLLTAAENGSVKLWSLPIVPERTLAGHTDAVTATAISADAKQLITGGSDASVKIFKSDDGALVRALPDQPGPVTSVGFHDATGMVISGSTTGIVKLWNAADGADRGSLFGHQGAIRDVGINAKGNMLLSAGDDGTLRVWRLPRASQVLAGSTGPVLSVAASRDGKWVVTGSTDKSLRLYNTADGAAVRTFSGAAAPVLGVAIRADQGQLASVDDSGDVRLFDPAQAASQDVLSGHIGPANSISYLPDGKTLLTGGDDGAVRWWALPPTPAKPLPPAGGAVSHIVRSTAGSELVAASVDGAVRVFTAATGALARALPGHVGPVAALDTGGPVVASGDEKGDIRIWTLSTAASLPTISGHDGPLTALAVNAQGTQIATSTEDGVIKLWKMPIATKTLAGSAMPVAVAAFSADGTLVASAGIVAGKATIIVRDAATGAVKSTMTGHTAAVSSLAFSVDKTKLISGSADKTARVWNIAAAQGAELGQFAMDAAVSAVALDANGQQAFCGAANGVLKQWKTADGEETRALVGHTGAVTSLQLHGASLISGSVDKTVRQWNLANGAAIRSISHAAPVTSVTISGNGSTIASAGTDKLVKLWNAANGAALPVLTGHADAVRQVSLSADGAQVVSVGGDGIRTWNSAGQLLQRFPLGDGTLRGAAFGAAGVVASIDGKHVLHIATPSLVRRIEGHVGAVGAIAFTPNGAALATGGADKTVRLWNVADGKPRATFAGSTDVVADLAISTDGKLLAAGGADKIARIWPLPAQAAATPAVPQSEFTHATAITSLTFSPDGARLAVAHALPSNTAAAAAPTTSIVTVWDQAVGQPLQRLAGHAADVADVAFLADNATVATGSADKTIVLRTLSAQRVNVAAVGKLFNLSLSTDGTQFATCGEDKKVNVWNAATGAKLFEVGMGAVAPVTVALRGDKLQLAAAGSDNKLYLWPLTAQRAGAAVTTDLPAAVARLQFSDDGNKLAAACADKQLRVYNATDGALLESIPTTDAPIALAFTPDAMALAAAGGNAALLQPLSATHQLLGHEGAVTAATFSADGASVFSGGADKTVRQWTLADGKATRTFTGATDAITGLALSGDGMTLAACGADKFMRTWPTVAGPASVTAAQNIEHAAPVRDVSLSAEGSRAATACDDGVVRVWDTATGRELQRFTNHKGAALAATIAADGKSLVSSGADKTALYETVAVQQLIVAADTRVADAEFLADGSAIATSGVDQQIKLWDALGKPLRQLVGAKAELAQIAVRNDGVQIASADADGRLMLWNTADGALQHTIETGAAIHDLAFSPDHTRIAVAGADNHLRVFQTSDGLPLQDQTAAAPLLAAAFTSTGAELLTGSADNAVSLWAYASPTPIADLAGHTGAVLHVAYSADGKTLATASADASVRTWNLETKAAIRVHAGHAGAVYASRFTSDGKQLVSCGADGTVRLWNAANGAAVRQMTVTTEEGVAPPALFDAAISGNNQSIAAAGQDGVIRIWNLSNGQPAKPIPAGPDPAYRIAFLPSNQILAAGHAGNITIWNPVNAAQVAALKAPGVAYSAAVSPVEKRAAIPCADGKTYFITLP